MAMKSQRRSRDIALFFLKPRCWMRVRGQRHAPAALPPGEKPGTHCTGGWLGPGGVMCDHRRQSLWPQGAWPPFKYQTLIKTLCKLIKAIPLQAWTGPEGSRRFEQWTCTCFKQAYCSSSGGTTVYIQQFVYVMHNNNNYNNNNNIY